MARYYAEVTGSRGTTVTKTGDIRTGMDAHIRGWDKGVRVIITLDELGNDVIRVYETGGSNNASGKLIKEIK